MNRTNALISKIRNSVDDKILSYFYFAIFESNLNYGFLVWAQNYNAINRLVILRKTSAQNYELEIQIAFLHSEKFLPKDLKTRST